MQTPDPNVYGVYPSGGFHPADGRVEKLDETWSAVVVGAARLICVLRRRDDGGIELFECGSAIEAIAVHVGGVPVRRYPGASRWRWGAKERWLLFATPGAYPNYVGFVPPVMPRVESVSRADLHKSADRLLADAFVSSGGAPGAQLRECGYESIARNAEGTLEVFGDPRIPGMPLVGRGGEQWYFLQPGRELYQWMPDPRMPFRGAVTELRLFHRAPKPVESGGLPSPHFHLDDGPNVADAIVVGPM